MKGRAAVYDTMKRSNKYRRQAVPSLGLAREVNFSRSKGMFLAHFARRRKGGGGGRCEGCSSNLHMPQSLIRTTTVPDLFSAVLSNETMFLSLPLRTLSPTSTIHSIPYLLELAQCAHHGRTQQPSTDPEHQPRTTH